MKKPRSTLILSPLSRAGMRHDENATFIKSVLPDAFAAVGVECTHFPLIGLDQAQARAEMLSAFYYHKQFEDALFIDSDIVTHPDYVLKLATLEEPLLACCYEDRLPNTGIGEDGGTGAFLADTQGYQPVVMREGMHMLPMRGGGLGLTRIRRSVVDGLWDWARANPISCLDDPKNTFTTRFYTSHYPGLMGLEVCGLFDPITHEHPEGSGVLRRRPEDLSFFHRCQMAGFQAYAPIEVPLIHAGRGGRSMYDAMIEDERLKSARRRRVAFELLECPENMVGGCAHVLDGAYDIPGLELEPGETILDLGANIGSFSAWALHRFPDCVIQAYEPDAKNAQAYRVNVSQLHSRATLHQVAVTGSEATRILLHSGKGNDGEHTIHPVKGVHADEGTEVEALPARKLPPAAILKIDTEGAEREILEKYQHWTGVKAVLLEWHSYQDYHYLQGFLRERGFRPYVDRSRGRAALDRELCFARPEALSTHASKQNGSPRDVSGHPDHFPAEAIQ